MQSLSFNFRLIRKLVFRYTIVWVADAASIGLTALVVPDIYFTRDPQFWFLTPFLVSLLFGLFNALVRPVLIILFLPITFMTLGLATMALNAGLFYFTHLLVQSFVIESFWAAAVGVIVLTFVNTLMGNVTQLSDDYSFYATLMNKFSSLTKPKEVDYHERGLVVLQIDGLSYDVIKWAIRRGKMPFLSDLLKRRRYLIRRWFCGLPSQTSSVQAGIFYGDNFDIPGFRWYDKEHKRLIVSSSSSDMHDVDERFSVGHSALLKDGTCINTLIHGGASKKILTISALMEKDIRRRRGELEDFAIFSLHPYLYTRTLFLMFWDFLIDRFESLFDVLKLNRRRVKRGLKFSFIRSVGNAFFRESTTYFVMEDIVRGIPIIYANFIGYDMVAHHTGPDARDAVNTLTGIDRQIKKINKRISRRAPKHFDLVVLSDHGQTPSVPFESRYGQSLAEFIEQLLKTRLTKDREYTVERGYFSTLLREMRLVEEAYGTPPIIRSRKTLEKIHARIWRDSAEEVEHDSVVVCASGNLAHVYFTETSERVTTESLFKYHPNLLEALVSHPGIGFVITTNSDGEYLIMGKTGLRRVRSGIVEGNDPLKPYLTDENSDAVVEALTRLCSYPHSGDLILNGSIQDNGIVVTFEEQRGTHGGLGGAQTDAFVIYPRRFRKMNDRMNSPVEMNHFLKSALAG